MTIRAVCQNEQKKKFFSIDCYYHPYMLQFSQAFFQCIAYTLLYWANACCSLVQAEYWNDPLNQDEYKKSSVFLADINDENVSKCTCYLMFGLM